MSVELQRRLFNVDGYHAMVRAGVLTEDDRVELIEGEIVEMTPIGSRHSACVARLTHLLTKPSADRWIVWVQSSIRLSDIAEPEPDLALLRPRDDFYSERHHRPSDVLLLIEVADTSLELEYDRELKLPLYARSGIPEVWIVDLREGAVEVHRSRTAESAEGYAESLRVGAEGVLRPSELPEIEVAVREVV